MGSANAHAKAAMHAISANSRNSSSPIPKLFIGLLLIFFFLVGSLLHIQTSEAFFLGGQTVGLSPNWGILLQPWQLFTGQLTPRMAQAVMWGWGIEMTFLICVVGYETAHDAVAASSRRMASIFRTGTLALVVFNGWADFQYGNIASGFWGQVAFALITSFVVFFFGTIGWRLIESALTDWNR